MQTGGLDKFTIERGEEGGQGSFIGWIVCGISAIDGVD